MTRVGGRTCYVSVDVEDEIVTLTPSQTSVREINRQ
jgi:hypothetical protein